MKLGGDTNLREWKELTKQRNEAISQWLDGVQIKKCPECGQAYSFGYPPVVEDPGKCQGCRDAEGDLIF